MKSAALINIYLVDNDVLFLEEFKSTFNCEQNHTLYTFSSVQKFLAHLKEQSESHFSIVIINDMIMSHGLNTKSVVEILPLIKNIDKETSVIVLTDSDNRELKLSSSDLRPDAFVKNDKMLYFKLTPLLNRIVCRYELKRNKLNLRVAIVMAILVIALVVAYMIVASVVG